MDEYTFHESLCSSEVGIPIINMPYCTSIGHILLICIPASHTYFMNVYQLTTCGTDWMCCVRAHGHVLNLLSVQLQFALLNFEFCQYLGVVILGPPCPWF